MQNAQGHATGSPRVADGLEEVDDVKGNMRTNMLGITGTAP